MNIKRIRLTRFEREDNFDFNLIRGVNQLLFTSITDQQCRMSFNRPWTISIYCRITLINVAGFSLIFTSVLHPSPPHHPVHHCFAPLHTPPPYSPLFVPLQHPHHPFSTDQCPAGKFSADGSGHLCRVCPKDTYQDQPGETACKNCEHGTKTLQLAATSAEACGGKRLIYLD